MRSLLAVVAFSVLTIAFFAGYSNFGIPQIEPAPPPVEEELDLGSMTVESFVALGKRIYDGKGTCTLCHNPVGGRAPLLEQVAQVVPERLADARYEGEASDVASYLTESMIEPSAYVVAGFGKAGTNDSVSPMPDVRGGGIRLSEAEMNAVIAFLQDSGGVEVTVEVAAEASGGEEEEDAAEDSEEAARAPLETPEAAVAEFACGACHIVAGEEGDLGPDLSHIGAARDRDYLRRAILDPNADVAEGFEADTMPPDYGLQLYASELEMLVDYLAELK